MPGNWQGCGGDYYPCIGVALGESDKPFSVHFDTGSTHTLFSAAWMEAAGVDMSDAIEVDVLTVEGPGGKFDDGFMSIEALNVRCEIFLHDGASSVRLERNILVVADWDDSPYQFTCATGSCVGSTVAEGGYRCGLRVGIVGRDILRDREGVVITLDGSQRQTSISASKATGRPVQLAFDADGPVS